MPQIFILLTVCVLAGSLLYALLTLKKLRRENSSMEVSVKDLSLEKTNLQKQILDEKNKINETKENVSQLDKLKDDFVSIASHELRTPMTAIRSYAWMALYKSDTKLSEKLTKYLVRILISTERMINLVNDLLNVSRIEAGKIEMNLEPVDLILLSKDVLDEVYYSKSKDKEIKFHIAESKIPKVLADAERLREVMLNLVGNAAKFTPPGGKVDVEFFTDGKAVETSIKDTGEGFSKEDLSKLFQKFGKLDDSYVSVSTSGGTGLGLYISKNLIELMHGRIWANSKGLGKGATFTFSLPVAL